MMNFKFEGRGPWLQTASGRQFFPLDPRPEEIFVEDLAHQLAAEPRYAGATEEPYSVAQHCVLLSYAVSAENAWAALHHEDPEAWLKDVPGPLKPFFPDYQHVEDKVWIACVERFRLPLILPREVMDLDLRVRLNERRDLMSSPPASWGSIEGLTPIEWGDLLPPMVLSQLRFCRLGASRPLWKIRPWPFHFAREKWRRRFNELEILELARRSRVVFAETR